jgi:hypothetical protein
MNNYIICNDGIAFMSLCKNKEILISGSLTNASFWSLPPSIILDIREYDLIPNDKDLEDNKITNYKILCELKVDIVLNNSICLRLYKKDIDNDCEDDTIGFKITEKELLKIAKIYITL